MKKILLSLLIVLTSITLTGCFQNEKFDASSYNKDYIEFNKGRFWANYSIMQEKLNDGTTLESFILLKAREGTNGEYAPIHRIPKENYQPGYYILGNDNYVFIFNYDSSSQNGIVRYSTKRSNRKTAQPTFKEKLTNIVPLGIKDDYIYISYENNKYAKINFDLDNLETIDKEPSNFDYLPVR